MNLIITDIGCGTGLGNRLLDSRHQYVGIDSSEKAIKYCRSIYEEGLFIQRDADEAIKHIETVNPLFMFSLDYLSVETIHEFIKKTDKIFMAIHYNKPYLSGTSAYKGDKQAFSTIHPKWKERITRGLFERYDANTFKLLDEEYYYVTIIKKDDENEHNRLP